MYGIIYIYIYNDQMVYDSMIHIDTEITSIYIDIDIYVYNARTRALEKSLKKKKREAEQETEG